MDKSPPLSECLVCKSTDLLSDVAVLDRDDMMTHQQIVGRDRNPDAFMFKGTTTAGLYAFVCATCGFVHNFVEDPARLKF